MKKLAWAVVLTAALTLLGAPSLAQATEGPETVEVYWEMPEGASPDNVLWDQFYSPDGATTCQAWYQVDTYLVEEAAIFTEDGVLTQGEDYGNQYQTGAISWRFEQGPDCVTVPDQPEPRITQDQRTENECWPDSDNSEANARIFVYGWDTTFPTFYDEPSNTWIEGEGVVGDEYVISADEVWLDNCVIDEPPVVEPPVVEPPVIEPPVVEPPVVEPPAVEPPAATEPPAEVTPVVETQATAQLAETGPELSAAAGIGVFLVLIGVVAFAIRKRKTQ